MKVHHIGYLVKNISEAAAKFEALGYRRKQEGYDFLRKIDICFMVNEVCVVELIESKAEDSAVAGMVNKIGVSPYHICYCAKNFQADIQSLYEQGYIPMGEAEPAVVLGGKRVMFLFHPQIGIIEVLEGSE